MSEHDRGAYTPPTDEPLAFDARPVQRTRRPLPLTLVGSAVVLVALVGAVVVFYQSGVRGANEPPRAVGATVAQIKTAPVPEEAKPVAEQPGGLDVYVDDKSGAPAAGPTFAPGPEQPMARPLPAAQAPVQAPAPTLQTPPAAVPTQAVAAQQLRPAEPAPLKPVVVAQAPAPKPAATAPAQVPAPAPVKLAAAAPAPAKAAPAPTAGAPAAAAGAAVVQIGAFNSTAIADQELGKIRAAFGRYVAGKGKRIEPVAKGGSTLYRTAFTGFSKAEAQAFCGALKAAGKACIVK
jgi:hypothetical protein